MAKFSTAFRPSRENQNAALIGLLLAVGVAAAIVVAIGVLAPPEPVVGRVTAFVVAGGGRNGIGPAAVVQVEGRSVTVRAAQSTTCQVGSEIALIRRRNLFGAIYGPAYAPGVCTIL